ncbi:MAG TPA: hemerythrin domain-containing protein [Burkholderiales bacterium]|nr:hemerythrin domain-containing protein [Burkholderiales bacterium]
MIVPVVAWHEEHVYFTLLLHMLQKELDLFRDAGLPNYALMQDIVSYLRDYGDEYHHPREDEAFRRMLPRCPELALELARLQQEHAVIAHAGEALSAHLEAIGSGALVPRAQVEAAAATYLVYYRNHLMREEEEVLTRATQVLTEEDWEAIRQCAPAGGEPGRGLEHYRELRRRIALEA